jgi:ArsR family transcriptional regulator
MDYTFITAPVKLQTRIMPLDISIFIDIIRVEMKPKLTEFAKAVADPTRQEIMQHLCCEWLSVNDVVEKLEGRVNQPTVSHHLKLLADAGLAAVRQEGRQRFYTLNQDRVAICCGMLIDRFAPEHRDVNA